jgi:diguanylate cyclase (GGDEF)-like protein/PAS domain S-box-containing protein
MTEQICSRSPADDGADSNSVWFWELDCTGVYTYSSAASFALLGYQPQQILGCSLLDLLVEDERPRMRAGLERTLQQQMLQGWIHRKRRSDGALICVESKAIPRFSQDGQLLAFCGWEREVRVDHSGPGELEAACDLSPIPLCMVDARLCFAAVNTALAQLLGSTVAALRGRAIADFLPMLLPLLQPEHSAPALDATPGPEKRIELDGRHYQASIKSFAVDGAATHNWSVALTDITALKYAKQELARLNQLLSQHAHEDHLTGLCNRRHLDEVLQLEIKRARRESASVSVLMIDLDHFKQYNDRHGHPAGDECLRIVAAQLAGVVSRSSDCLGRWGGEEFMVILPRTGSKGAEILAQRIQNSMSELVFPPDLQPDIPLTLSVGVATLRLLAGSADFDSQLLARRLLALSDQALYKAKGSGRNQIVVQPSLTAQAVIYSGGQPPM